MPTISAHSSRAKGLEKKRSFPRDGRGKAGVQHAVTADRKSCPGPSLDPWLGWERGTAGPWRPSQHPSLVVQYPAPPSARHHCPLRSGTLLRD